MKNKLFLAALLITPLAVLIFSTLSFQSGYSPKDTKNNGTFFQEYFDVTDLNLQTSSGNLTFEDGKWIFGTYGLEAEDLEQALYLMRQLNVALNKDIYKMKRVIFIQDRDSLKKDQLIDYPRTEIITNDDKLSKQLLEAGDKNFFLDQKIFIIDSYGRAALFWPTSMDPKLILKDLKVLMIVITTTLAVITLGAYVRLSHAGLGCPDWPGCYGYLIGVPDNAIEISLSKDIPSFHMKSTRQYQKLFIDILPLFWV